MTATTWITDDMRAAVGREVNRSTSYPISASGGIVAPEEFNPFAWMSADPPGRPASSGGIEYEARLGLAPVETTKMLNGGTEVTYGVRMRPGDEITAVTTLTGYEEREGRLGLMLFTRTTVEWTNQRDELVKSLVSTLIRY